MSDLIDRQQAIDTLENTKTAISENGERYIAKQNAIMRIDALPSAQPKRGKWIIYTVSPFDGEDVKCSECGQRGCAPYWNYCPNCGAKMEVKE